MASDQRHGKGIVLLSGGVDSATVLALAKAQVHELYALSFDYSQRHRRELASARKLAGAFGVARHLIVSINLREIGGSALTGDMAIPRGGLDEQQSGLEDRSGRIRTSGTGTPSTIPATYVPARNTIFLSIALGWAEVLGTGRIFIGVNAVDYSGYPDCRPEYLHAFERMANLATKASVEGTLRFSVEAPLLFMTKSEIIRTGREHGVDYALTWSCYDPQQRCAPEGGDEFSSFAACGVCESCRFREKGFREAGIEDPLMQRDRA